MVLPVIVIERVVMDPAISNVRTVLEGFTIVTVDSEMDNVDIDDEE